eukprot:scaffold57442_cov70-Phaeocystis_antarctica.AAC.10
MARLSRARACAGRARPRCWRAGARSRRAGGARSWRSCDAARGLASLRVTPCRHSARAWWRRRHRGPRGVPARVPTWWRDRSAPSAVALSRFRERAGRRRLANNACSPTRWPGTALSVLAATRRASHPVLAAPPSPTRPSPPRSRAAAVWLVWRVSVSLTE